MVKPSELVDVLAALDEATFSDVYVEAVRRRDRDRAGAVQPPPRANGDDFARWLAHRHLESDASVRDVIYLPSGAPASEVRLLEVNRLLNAPAPDVIEPTDYTPDIAGLSFTVFVADITPDQWERIERGTLALPRGWELGGKVVIGRK